MKTSKALTLGVGLLAVRTARRRTASTPRSGRPIKRRLKAAAVLLAVAPLAAPLAPATAAQPQPVTILVTEQLTGPNSAAGTFTATGAIRDTGVKKETFRISGETIHAVERFYGYKGSFVLRVTGQVRSTGPTTLAIDGARWVVVTGTGAYKRLHGVGRVDVLVDLAAGTATNDHRGRVHVRS